MVDDKMPTPQRDKIWTEADRSAALQSYNVLDTPREEDFDELAQVASDICGTPIAVVNLVDTTRQFFKAEVGLGVRTTPLETAFCAHALLEDDVLVIPDASVDSRLHCNPLVTEAPHLRAYAGALL
jgi:GAF domain-containing protein